MRGPGRRKKSKSSFSPAHLCLLSVRTESKAPGRVRRLQGSERYHWVAGGLYNLRPISEKERAHNGASRRVDEVILRDSSSSTPTGRVRSSLWGRAKKGTPAACRGLCVPCGFVCLRIGYHKSGKQSMESFSGACQRFLYSRRYWAGVKPVVSRKLWMK